MAIGIGMGIGMPGAGSKPRPTIKIPKSPKQQFGEALRSGEIPSGSTYAGTIREGGGFRYNLPAEQQFQNALKDGSIPSDSVYAGVSDNGGFRYNIPPEKQFEKWLAENPDMAGSTYAGAGDDGGFRYTAPPEMQFNQWLEENPSEAGATYAGPSEDGKGFRYTPKPLPPREQFDQWIKENPDMADSTYIGPSPDGKGFSYRLSPEKQFNQWLAENPNMVGATYAGPNDEGGFRYTMPGATPSQPVQGDASIEGSTAWYQSYGYDVTMGNPATAQEIVSSGGAGLPPEILEKARQAVAAGQGNSPLVSIQYIIDTTGSYPSIYPVELVGAYGIEAAIEYMKVAGIDNAESLAQQAEIQFQAQQDIASALGKNYSTIGPLTDVDVDAIVTSLGADKTEVTLQTLGYTDSAQIVKDSQDRINTYTSLAEESKIQTDAINEILLSTGVSVDENGNINLAQTDIQKLVDTYGEAEAKNMLTQAGFTTTETEAEVPTGESGEYYVVETNEGEKQIPKDEWDSLSDVKKMAVVIGRPPTLEEWRGYRLQEAGISEKDWQQKWWNPVNMLPGASSAMGIVQHAIPGKQYWEQVYDIKIQAQDEYLASYPERRWSSALGSMTEEFNLGAFTKPIFYRSNIKWGDITPREWVQSGASAAMLTSGLWVPKAVGGVKAIGVKLGGIPSPIVKVVSPVTGLKVQSIFKKSSFPYEFGSGTQTFVAAEKKGIGILGGEGLAPQGIMIGEPRLFVPKVTLRSPIVRSTSGFYREPITMRPTVGIVTPKILGGEGLSPLNAAKSELSKAWAKVSESATAIQNAKAMEDVRLAQSKVNELMSKSGIDRPAISISIGKGIQRAGGSVELELASFESGKAMRNLLQAIEKFDKLDPSVSPVKYIEASSNLEKALNSSRAADIKLMEIMSGEKLTPKIVKRIEKASGISGINNAMSNLSTAVNSLKKSWDIANRYEIGSKKYIEALKNVEKARAEVKLLSGKLKSVLSPRIGQVPYAGWEKVMTEADKVISDARIEFNRAAYKYSGDRQISVSNADDVQSFFDKVVKEYGTSGDASKANLAALDEARIGLQNAIAYRGKLVEMMRKGDFPPEGGISYNMMWEEGGTSARPSMSPTEEGMARYRPMSPEAMKETLAAQTRAREAYFRESGVKPLTDYGVRRAPVATMTIEKESPVAGEQLRLSDLSLKPKFAEPYSFPRTEGMPMYAPSARVSSIFIPTSALAAEAQLLKQKMQAPATIIPSPATIVPSTVAIPQTATEVSAMTQGKASEMTNVDDLVSVGLQAATVAYTDTIARGDTDANAMINAQNAIKISIHNALENLTQEKTLTKTQLQTLTEAGIQAQAKAQVIARETMRPAIPIIPIIPTSGGELAGDEALIRGTIVWRQGELGEDKDVWWITPPPYDKKYYKIGEAPEGVTNVDEGEGSAYKTIQVIGGVIDKSVKLDLGWADVLISPDKDGKAQIKFTRDPNLVYKGKQKRIKVKTEHNTLGAENVPSLSDMEERTPTRRIRIISGKKHNVVEEEYDPWAKYYMGHKLPYNDMSSVLRRR